MHDKSAIIMDSLVATIQRLEAQAVEDRLAIESLQEEKGDLIHPRNMPSVLEVLKHYFWNQLRDAIREEEIPLPAGVSAFVLEGKTPEVHSSTRGFYFNVPVVRENRRGDYVQFWFCLLPYVQMNKEEGVARYPQFSIQWTKSKPVPKARRATKPKVPPSTGASIVGAG